MAPNRYVSSNAQPATLSSSMTSAQTTLAVTQNPSTLGWPASYPYTLLLDWGNSNPEVVTITQAATGTGPYTFSSVTRGQDGTTASAHTAPQSVYHGTSGQDSGEPQYHAQASGPVTYPPNGKTVPVHGIASGSAVVGTTDTQTLSNKTLASPTFTGATSGLIDTTAMDVAPPALTTFSPGSVGKASDSGHVHGMSLDTWHTLTNATNTSGLFRVMLVSSLNAVWFDFEVTFSNTGGTAYTFGSMPSSSYYPNATTWPNGRHMPIGLTGAPTGVASNLPRLFIPNATAGGGPQLLIPTMSASGAGAGGSFFVLLS
jgi:hypothetical protein